MHVPALDGGWLVVAVLVAVVGDEVTIGEQGMETVDGPSVEQLAPAGRLGHRVHRYATVDPAGVVALKEMVGQRSENEVVGPEHVPLEAVGVQGLQVSLEDPADQVVGKLRPVQAVEEATSGPDQRRAKVLRSAYPIEDEVSSLATIERLGQQLTVEVHLHPLGPEGIGEGIMLLSGPLRPDHVVEEEFADVLGCEPRQFEPRSVHDGLA